MNTSRLMWWPSRRTIWFVLALVTVGAVVFFAVFPTRDYFAQREERSERGRELSELESTVDELEARIEALHSDPEIESLAREEYHLVYPAEEAYTVLPPPRAITTTSGP